MSSTKTTQSVSVRGMRKFRSWLNVEEVVATALLGSHDGICHIYAGGGLVAKACQLGTDRLQDPNFPHRLYHSQVF